VEIKWAPSAATSEITYLSLVADDARARHGGDRMVERWQSVGVPKPRHISSLLLRDPKLCLSSRLLSLRSSRGC
jgi:hypothetical protein